MMRITITIGEHTISTTVRALNIYHDCAGQIVAGDFLDDYYAGRESSRVLDSVADLHDALGAAISAAKQGRAV